MDSQKHFANSLGELSTEVESTIQHAKELSYSGVRADMSIEVAQELIKAVKYYQEPRFFGWPLSLVELYLEEEEQIPDNVFSAYQEHVNALGGGDDIIEAFFIDEAYDN